jgi:hypothetical protein
VPLEGKCLGITGHQDLRDAAWVEATLSKLLRVEQIAEGITSLARGADQLFARCLLRADRSFRVVIPCRNYENAFEDDDSLKGYRQLLALAAGAETLDYDAPSEEAFYAAGKRIVDRACVLIAVWDGLPSRGLGGTADVVAYARASNKKVIHINSTRKDVSALN